ncbi:MAG: DUF1349 domain-containing protein [Sphaerochaetaceae bacterium]
MLQGNCIFTISDNSLTIKANQKTDFFVNPVDGKIADNAAFVSEQITGDFVCRAKISLIHSCEFDGGALFVYQDSTHWVKACFEKSSYSFNDICTVVTNGLSDDCNGAIIQGNSIWLQIARTDTIFSIHYSFDGDTYILARICFLAFDASLKVGFEAQSPIGDGCECTFTEYSIEQRTLSDPRAGE